MNRILMTQSDTVVDAAIRQQLFSYGLETDFCPPSGLTILQRLRQQFYIAVVLRRPPSDLSLPALFARYALTKNDRGALLPWPRTQFFIVQSTPDAEQRAALLEMGFAEVLTPPVSEYRIASLLVERSAGPLLDFQTRQQALRLQYAKQLRALGIPAHLKGFAYLTDCLVYLASDPGALYQVTKVLYPQVARQNGTSASNLERSMRTAVSQMTLYGSREAINTLLYSNQTNQSGRLCVSGLLAALSLQQQAQPRRQA